MKILHLWWLLLCAPALAHEVHVEQSVQGANVVRLRYADGQPFAFEAYELYLPGKDMPEQVGRSNGQGQIVFLAGSATELRLKAFTADGHGIDQILKLLPTAATPGATPGAAPAAAPATETPRALLLAAGFSFLFGLFGIFQLFLRKKPA